MDPRFPSFMIDELRALLTAISGRAACSGGRGYDRVTPSRGATAMMIRLHWFWCWLCFKAYLALPMPRTHKSLYGKFSLWILGYAGYYAHSPSPFSHESQSVKKEQQDASR